MRNLILRNGTRQLHTIISRDIIKPSSPTPSHLKTYNLSLLDHLAVKAYMPVVAIYPNSDLSQTSQTKTRVLKSSLSQTLTRYYPFAGRIQNLGKIGQTYVDCNDEGVEFIEAFNDTPLLDFLKSSELEDLDQLFPDDLIWYKPVHRGDLDDERKSFSPLTVQINHFACGGIAVAASLSHKIADASSLFHFIDHWATTTRSRSHEITPNFIRYQSRSLDYLPKELHERPKGDCLARSFVFPNSKINSLKEKIITMTKDCCQPIVNPSRIEALTWLIHKCAVEAASKRDSGILKSTGLGTMMNIRNNLVDSLPETSVGNLYLITDQPTTNESELAPETLISELRKRKMEVRRIKDMETALANVAKMCCEIDLKERVSRLDEYYFYSVLCRFPAYEIDFGWGKPIKVTVGGGGVNNLIILMDTPDRDGIEALVSVDRQDLKIIQDDPELLAFC